MKWFWWVRISGTVIPAIWWQVLLLLIYTAAVMCLENYVPILYKPFPDHLITIIGTVIGLLLTFRTDTAYNRYWEGRELWSTMTQEMRKLTRAIWLGVKEVDAKDIVEKKSALNLCAAFIVSTKHYLREEYAYDYEDYEGLLEHLPKFYMPSSNMPLEKQLKEGKGKRSEFSAYDQSTPTNIPIEMSYYLSSYIKHIDETQMADNWTVATMQNSVASLVDCLAGFERILRTPMPLAYSIHLQESVWLFLLAIPYQTIGDVGPWFSIAIVGLASFCYLGILAIGFEIENPFGYDANDLPLEDFCNVMQLEIQKILVTDPPVAKNWLYDPENRPFGPMCSLSASQLSDLPLHEAKDILRSVSQTSIISNETGYRDKDTIKRQAKRRRSSVRGYQAL